MVRGGGKGKGKGGGGSALGQEGLQKPEKSAWGHQALECQEALHRVPQAVHNERRAYKPRTFNFICRTQSLPLTAVLPSFAAIVWSA